MLRKASLYNHALTLGMLDKQRLVVIRKLAHLVAQLQVRGSLHRNEGSEVQLVGKRKDVAP